MSARTSQTGATEAYEAPRLEVLGTVTELTEWCVLGKTYGTPDYFSNINIANCSS